MQTSVVTNKYCNPFNIKVADPNILFYEGTYYLYGTDEKRNARAGNCVYTSTDLVNWTEQELAFKKTPDTWSQRHFWGAEVIVKDDKFLMYYCCSPNRTQEPSLNMHLAAAVADSPLGPFEEIRTPLYAAPGKKDEVIDQNVFIDDDGKAYLYYVLVVIGSHNEVRVLKLKDNCLDIDGESVPCIQADQQWESNPWNGHKVAEAPFAFKRKGYYYLLYTCNHFLDIKYAVGYATSKSPLGPWKKYEGNPILKMNNGIRGPGNACITKSPDGTETFIVYHIHNSLTRVNPRLLSIDRLHFIADPKGGPDILRVDGPSVTPQPLPRGA